uniref:sensor histidine kinase n=1 Tax=Acetatifactor sp. TaxID=1872090 RepID=UPI004027F98D
MCILLGILLVILGIAFLWLLHSYRNKMKLIKSLRLLLSPRETGEEETEMYLQSCTPEDRELYYLISEKVNEEMYSKNLKMEAELHALQNQINPHFLYNTLEVIRGRALVQNAQDIADMTEALATIFRYNINRPGDVATLQEEIDNVRNYMLIQNCRFGDRFRFETEIEDVEDGILTHVLPVLTLQPLVENAIYHGINERIGGGRIRLKAYLTQRDLLIIISDNGKGMDDVTLQEIHRKLVGASEGLPVEKKTGRGTGIALTNVNQRIKFYFGKEYGLDVKSTLGIGTTITITIPRMVV